MALCLHDAQRSSILSTGKLSKGMPGFGLNIEEPEAVLQYCGHVMGAKTGWCSSHAVYMTPPLL